MALRADYYCNDCKELFEYHKEFGVDYPLTPECPKCAKTNTRRKFGVAGMIVPDHMKSINN